MSYQVIARRWRPQKFDQLVYQDHITKTLQNSITSGRISHSYIFTGPRGVGKTTTARILAKSLNCVNGPIAEPCGVCENCKEITQGNSFDVIEIDGASNNGVDNIRELRETVHFAPVKSTYKIYIIDEVHMLSTGAFNALLKTLEEPPAHVIFIFATTEIHKVPDTILSRCQKYFFKKISPDAIASHLASIIKEDNFSLSESSLFAIARAATGSMRDAQSLLEQVISFSNDSVTDQDVTFLLGIVPVTSYIELLQAIISQEPVRIVEITSDLFTTGINVSRYIGGLKETLRAIRFIKHDVTIDENCGFAMSDTQALKKISTHFSDEEISRFFSLLEGLTASLRFTENESLAFEMTLLDMLAVVKNPSLSSIIKKLEEMPEKKKPLNNSTQPHSAPARDPLPVKQAWSEIINFCSVQKKYLFELISLHVHNFSGTTITLTPKTDQKQIKNIDKDDIIFLQNELLRLCREKIQVIVLNETEEPPLPDKQMVRRDSQATAEEAIVEMHPTVQKIVDMFHGEIIKQKGDK
ncbi:MAG: DNA polymerase III subunit gamma/tau [Spirochaetes bacterium]|jgi:DNA polymerase-3 subunit gamma/tau|nr:DNA polymerase III subunit gamma/tau [Spirochaetota bacterium]